MSLYIGDKRLMFEGTSSQEENVDIMGGSRSFSNSDGEQAPPVTMETEKRIRREIANSNERRRMQSINNGFQSLRLLLPHHEGEKLSKAAILQQTAEYIYTLEQEKTRLLSQNCQLKRLVNQHEGGELPPKKRKTTEVIIQAAVSESSDEGLGSMSPEPVKVLVAPLNQSAAESLVELRNQLTQERNMRLMLEEQNRQLESQLYHQQTVYEDEVIEEDDGGLQLVAAESLPVVGHTQTVVCSPPISRSPSPEPVELVAAVAITVPQQTERLPSVLEAAIKAEPKVEVERLPSPTIEDTQTRVYVSNTSRQNLETIVEAIRHLEGDHMFGDDPLALSQDAPLELTTRTVDHVKLEIHPYVEFHHQSIQQQQQSRPGVIVGKQSSS